MNVKKFADSIPSSIIDISLKDFKETKNGGRIIEDRYDSNTARLIGLSVDYLIRYYITDDVARSFIVSLCGACRAKDEDNALKLIKDIHELDDKTMKATYKLVQYDDFVRCSSYAEYKNISIEKKNIAAVCRLAE